MREARRGEPLDFKSVLNETPAPDYRRATSGADPSALKKRRRQLLEAMKSGESKGGSAPAIQPNYDAEFWQAVDTLERNPDWPVCLHEFITDFYEKLGLDYRAKLRPDQVCRAPVLYSYENAQVWRPSRFDGSQTNATDFQVVSQPGDAFKQSSTIHTPRLEPYEEFPVITAKIRPVLLLVPEPSPVAAQELRGGGRINRHLCLVVPCYSVVDRMGKAKYSAAFLERVCGLEFPQFLFLPQTACLQNDSMCRLDSIQHVFRGQREPSQWMLSTEIRKIVSGQLNFLFTGAYEAEYKIARDMLITP